MRRNKSVHFCCGPIQRPFFSLQNTQQYDFCFWKEYICTAKFLSSSTLIFLQTAFCYYPRRSRSVMSKSAIDKKLAINSGWKVAWIFSGDPIYGWLTLLLKDWPLCLLSKYDFRLYDIFFFFIWFMATVTKQNWSNGHLKSVHKMHSVNHVESLKVDTLLLIEVIIELETMILPVAVSTQIENWQDVHLLEWHWKVTAATSAGFSYD